MKPEYLTAFEKVRQQIGYCGVWCGSCVVGNGALKRLTTKYQEILCAHGLEHWAPEDLDYVDFERSLRVVKRVASCAGCRKGGGRDDCELRSCCANKGLEDCLACDDQDHCSHGEILERMRSGARAAGLFVKNMSGSNTRLLSAWETELRSKWPSSVLFMKDA
jgi:hypothetical protein